MTTKNANRFHYVAILVHTIDASVDFYRDQLNFSKVSDEWLPELAVRPAFLDAGWHAYSSSKEGVMGLTRLMAADLAPYGIRAKGVVPGSIRTSPTKPLFDDPETTAKLAAVHPIARASESEDMARIAVFLASDDSKFATSAHFFVDGGTSVR